VGISRVGARRPRGRGVGLVGLQTLPQEFVALVHGLLECQAIDLVADRGEPPSDEHHGPTPTPDADRYHSSIGHVPPRRLPDAAQTPRALLPDGRDALAPALNTLGGRSR
jgi:hypothetical protein